MSARLVKCPTAMGTDRTKLEECYSSLRSRYQVAEGCKGAECLRESNPEVRSIYTKFLEQSIRDRLSRPMDNFDSEAPIRSDANRL